MTSFCLRIGVKPGVSRSTDRRVDPKVDCRNGDFTVSMLNEGFCTAKESFEEELFPPKMDAGSTFGTFISARAWNDVNKNGSSWREIRKNLIA